MPNKIKVQCPKCGENLEVEEFTEQYAILHDDHPVACCPGCLAPLIVVDGKLEMEDLK